MSVGGQCTKWCRNIAENFNPLSRVHDRYRGQTDRRTGDDIFAKTEENMQFRLTNSQRYLVNANPDSNHSTNPTYPTTKYHCAFINLNCIFALVNLKKT